MGLSGRNPHLRKLFGKAITSIQVSFDFFTVVAMFLISYWFYIGPLSRTSPQTFQEFFILTLVSAAIYVIVLDRVGVYRREISLLNIRELRGIFRAGIYASAAILSVSFYIRSTSFSRLTLTAAMISTPIALLIQRQIFYRIHILFHMRGWSETRVFIYGVGTIGQHLCRRLLDSPALGLLPVGFLDDDEKRVGETVNWPGMGARKGLPVFGGEGYLEKAAEHGVGMVLIALPTATFERNQHLVEACVSRGLEYAIVPNAYENFIQSVELFEIGGIPVLRRRKRQLSFYYLISKRVADFLVAFVALVFLSPLLIFFWTLIKLDSDGPVIFKQKRVGLHGKEFSFYKFRTMKSDAPKYAYTPQSATDPRITRVGKFLRRTSLDELPQLFNVLRGDMSLVGPRPEMPFIVEKYSTLERQRLDAKPGITGLWQISTFRGAPIHDHIEYDLFYLENRSLLLDFAILLKTLTSAVRGVGAV
jgi:exopolysaccharide biosynthesis polyprenyl glycosylphosphotransferase